MSTDGKEWTTVKKMRNQDGGEDTASFNGTKARYVKLQGVERGTGYGYSLWEMEVYGGKVSQDEKNTPSGTNVALNTETKQSGSENDAMTSEKAVDGNGESRWSSNYADDAWMTMDLGNAYEINKVLINWEGAYGKNYDILVSMDGENWTTVKEMRNQNGREDTVEFNAVKARYVKFQGVERGTGYGYSIWEMQVLTK